MGDELIECDEQVGLGASTHTALSSFLSDLLRDKQVQKEGKTATAETAATIGGSGGDCDGLPFVIAIVNDNPKPNALVVPPPSKRKSKCRRRGSTGNLLRFRSEREINNDNDGPRRKVSRRRSTGNLFINRNSKKNPLPSWR